MRVKETVWLDPRPLRVFNDYLIPLVNASTWLYTSSLVSIASTFRF
ncbi:MAG: hypothetical protein H6Q26_1541 [Bacteroidetes bacterium]|nr:hypothetical protein [Bacteroidota bacterium]